jgi:secreted Zn-dependent insulinase-like peptidase
MPRPYIENKNLGKVLKFINENTQDSYLYVFFYHEDVPKFKSKSIDYILNQLSSKDPSSLYSYLRNNSLAYSIDAGIYQKNSDFSLSVI